MATKEKTPGKTLQNKNSDLIRKLELLRKENIELREKLENKNGDQQNYLEIFTENAADILFIHNLTDCRVEYISPSIEKITGYTVEEALKHELHEVMTEESYNYIAPLQKERTRKLLAGEIKHELYVEELVHLKKDGSKFYSETLDLYTTKNDGTPIIVGVLRDVTERKELQLSLIKKNEELESAKKDLEYLNNKIEKELFSASINLALNNKLLRNTFVEIKQKFISEDKETQKELNRLLNEFKKKNLKLNWFKLMKKFDEDYPRFNNILEKKHPELTINEKRLCSLYRMNLTSSEIALLTFKSYDTIKKARTRLRKKLGINSSSGLTEYLLSLDK